jgi:ribosomal protein S18 acetylase RimI-like enzyme
MPTIRPATLADAPAISRVDTRYTVGRRLLSLETSGDAPELSYALRWRDGSPREADYGDYCEDSVEQALARTDLFLVAESAKTIVGLLMVIVPPWTNAGEITDLVVDRVSRRCGAGRALVAGAEAWARGRGLRALWVEPRGDFADAIEFYLALGFRLSGLNDRWTANDDAPGGQTLYMYLELTSHAPS